MINFEQNRAQSRHEMSHLHAGFIRFGRASGIHGLWGGGGITVVEKGWTLNEMKTISKMKRRKDDVISDSIVDTYPIGYQAKTSAILACHLVHYK